MARTTYKKRLIDGVEYFYEVVELPRKSNGKRNRKHVCARSAAELKKKLDKIHNDLYNGVDISNTNTFGSLFYDWFYNTHLKNKKISTQNRYEGVYNLYIRNSNLKNKKIKSLKAIDLQKFYNSLENENVSANTIKIIHNIIKPFLHFVYISGLNIRDLSISGTVKLPKIVKTNNYKTVLSLEDQQKFIDYLTATDNSDRLIYMFALGTGLRLGEILALTWDDITDGMVNVNKNIKCVKIDDKWTIIVQDTPKTEKSNRIVPIPDNILSELELHQKKQNEFKNFIGDMYTDNNIVFPTELGTYIDPSNLNRRFKKSLVKAGLNPIKFHSLRHTYATRLFENNVQPKVVSDLLGHKDITTTLNIYTWVMESQKNKALEAINNIF